ncbi:MAG: rod shape-determining protein MreC [Armatimonadetes bacterium]|nr:rod shape-determining protein MreC [Armatimonadota bacterium]
MRAEREFPTRTAAILAVLAIAFTIWQHVAWSRTSRAWPEKAIISLLTPGQVILSRSFTALSDLAFSLACTASLRAENRALREQVSSLQADKVRLMEYFLENKQLLRELNAPPAPTLKRLAVARVIGRSPGRMRRRITIQVADGVEMAKDDFLLSGGCLVGRVTEAHGSVGVAVLIVDFEHALAVLDQRSRDQGMLYAEPNFGGPDMLRLGKIPGRTDLRPGDVIVTSGLGQVYPRGIPVGVIDSVQVASGAGQPVGALVRPFVDFDHLEFVSVARAAPSL